MRSTSESCSLISSNIAEGAAKPSDNEFAHFLDMALGSAFEVETQLIIANKIGYINNENENPNENEEYLSFQVLFDGIKDIERQLAGLIKSMRES